MKKNRIFTFLAIFLLVAFMTASIGFAKDDAYDKDKDRDKIRDSLEHNAEELKKSGLGNKKISVIISIDDVDTQNVRKIIESLNGRITYEYEIIDAVAAFVPAGNIELLADYNYVSFIDADAEAHISEQIIPWGISRVDASSVWTTSSGLGADVAVLDTGIDPQHQDLSQNIEFGIAFERGMVRDNWEDKNGHGTHVAGTIAALDNAIGVVGVAHSTDLYAVRVLNRRGSGFVSDIIAGIDFSVKGPDGIVGTDDDAEVVSMSLGTTADILEFKNAVDSANAQGVVVVAAAGNSGDGNPSTQETSFPAAYSSVIAVGAIDIDNAAASFSNSGNYLELAAPGVGVYSTYLSNTYATLSGTSMATPHVSGTVALMKSANPSLTPDEIRIALQSTATDLGGIGWDTVYGYGLVNALAAVSDVSAPDTTPPLISNITIVNITSSSATITWITDEPSDSRVNYGLTTSYGSFVFNPALATSHSIALIGLPASTTHHFNVTSVDASGNSASSIDNTFTTLATPTLTSISVTPINVLVSAGSTQQFAATGFFSDGSTSDLTSEVNWTSSNTSVAIISAFGLADALSEGTTTIGATSGAVSGNTTLTVNAQSNDIVAITQAQFTTAKKELQVKATSTNPNAILTVEGYGTMRKRGDIHQFRSRNVLDPGETITVTSSSGGSDTALVQHI